MAAASSEWYGSSWFYKVRRSASGKLHADRSVSWNFARTLSLVGPGTGRTLLDVGCAEGEFLYLAAKAGFHVTGLDFNPVSLNIAKEVFQIPRVYQYSAEELANRFPEADFDVVTLFEVLEHTADPFETICSLKRVMKAGSLLFVSVPGLKRWPTLFHPEVDSPPHHLTLWTEEALRKILERAGLRVELIEKKPLQVDDFGIHLKWRLQRLLSAARGRSGFNEGAAGSNSELMPASGSSAIRFVAGAALSPVCALLRLHPRSGGFSLLAGCRKP